jgi:hypothetical protein
MREYVFRTRRSLTAVAVCVGLTAVLAMAGAAARPAAGQTLPSAKPGNGKPAPKPAAQPQSANLVTFDAHMKQLQAATYEQYKNRPGAKVQNAAAFNEMKAYLQNMYKGVKVNHSFVAHDGSHVDVIPFDQQPALRQPALKNHKVQHTPPPPPAPAKSMGKKMPATKGVAPFLAKGKKDQFGNEMYAAPGTIPMRRVTLNELTHFRTLKEYRQKDHTVMQQLVSKKLTPKTTTADLSGHRWAFGFQAVENLGGTSWLNLWDPQPVSGGFSLSQQWISGGDPLQTAEAGWQVFPSRYGTNQPVLFVYWTADDYNTTGDYNLTYFIQDTNLMYIGQPLSPVSTDGGTEYGFRLTWLRDFFSGNWHLYYQGDGDLVHVGYFARELYGSGQMSKSATEVAFGGEVFVGPPWSPMGSGAPPTAGAQHAAFQKDIGYFTTAGGSSAANLSPFQLTPKMYSTDIHNEPSTWGTYLFFGGPGGTD